MTKMKKAYSPDEFLAIEKEFEDSRFISSSTCAETVERLIATVNVLRRIDQLKVKATRIVLDQIFAEGPFMAVLSEKVILQVTKQLRRKEITCDKVLEETNED